MVILAPLAEQDNENRARLVAKIEKGGRRHWGEGTSGGRRVTDDDVCEQTPRS
jgi:hypothetical protein